MKVAIVIALFGFVALAAGRNIEVDLLTRLLALQKKPRPDYGPCDKVGLCDTCPEPQDTGLTPTGSPPCGPKCFCKGSECKRPCRKDEDPVEDNCVKKCNKGETDDCFGGKRPGGEESKCGGGNGGGGKGNSGQSGSQRKPDPPPSKPPPPGNDGAERLRENPPPKPPPQDPPPQKNPAQRLAEALIDFLSE